MEESKAQSKFNLGGVMVLREFQGSRTINLNAFSGGASFTIWDSNQRGMPVDSISLSRSVSRMLIRTMKNIIKAQPNTNVTVAQSQWDKNQNGGKGGWVKGNLFKFIKDDKQTYAMEVSTPKMEIPLKVAFRGPKLTIDTDDLTDSQRSELALMDLIEVLEHDVPLIRLLSRLNMPKPTARNNNNSSSDNISSEQKQSYTNDDEAPY